MMERWHYLLVLAACVAVTLPLELVLGARVYRRPWLVTRTLLPVLAAFAAWDLLAHARGVWWFDADHTLGPRLAGLPLEEWLFFLVVPLCALLTYEAVGIALRRRWSPPPRPATGGEPAAPRARATRPEVHRG